MAGGPNDAGLSFPGLIQNNTLTISTGHDFALWIVKKHPGKDLINVGPDFVDAGPIQRPKDEGLRFELDPSLHCPVPFLLRGVELCA